MSDLSRITQEVCGKDRKRKDIFLQGHLPWVTPLSSAGVDQHASGDWAGVVDTVSATSCLRSPGIARGAAGACLYTGILNSAF